MICSDKHKQKKAIPVFFEILNCRNSHLQRHYPLFSSYSFASRSSQFTSADFLRVSSTAASHPESLARLRVSRGWIWAQAVCLRSFGWCLVHLDSSIARKQESGTMPKSCLLAMGPGQRPLRLPGVTAAQVKGSQEWHPCRLHQSQECGQEGSTKEFSPTGRKTTNSQ